MAPRNRAGQRRTQDEEEPDDANTGFTDEQLNALSGLVNAAVSGHVQRKLPAIVQSAVAGPIGELRALIEGRNGGAGGQGASSGDDDPDDDPGEEQVPTRRTGRATGRQQPAPARQRADPAISIMQRKLDAIEAERKVEREANRAKERDGSLREHLTKLGVDPNRMRGAIAVLRDSTRYDEKNNEWFYARKVDGVEEEFDLAAGAADWAGTDEGKAYIAPAPGGNGARQPQRGGSGTRPSAGNTPALRGSTSPVADPKQAKAQGKAAAMQTLTSAINSLQDPSTVVG